MNGARLLFQIFVRALWVFVSMLTMLTLAFFTTLYFNDPKLAHDFGKSCVSCKKPSITVSTLKNPKGGGLDLRDWRVVISPATTEPKVMPELNPTEQQSAALSRVNHYRSVVGLKAVTLNKTINKASTAHATYNVSHNLSGHIESNSDTGFTGAWPWDRMRHFGYDEFTYATEVCSMRWSSAQYLLRIDPQRAIDGWVDTVYHRLPIINPNVYETGFGAAKAGDRVAYVMDFANPGFPISKKIIYYPADAQTNVPVKFTGDETPDPLPGAKYPVGYPITITFNGYKDIKIIDVKLTDSNGVDVKFYKIMPFSDKYIRDSIAIIPKRPLEYGMDYRVSINANADDDSIYLDWRFKTKTSD